MSEAEHIHRPVLRDEVVRSLDLHDGSVIIDATLGLGGHSEAILEHEPTATVIGIDQDERALELARARLDRFKDRFRAFHANFSEVSRVAKDAGSETVDGIVADLGVSSLQLDDPDRGFSFRFDA